MSFVLPPWWPALCSDLMLMCHLSTSQLFTIRQLDNWYLHKRYSIKQILRNAIHRDFEAQLKQSCYWNVATNQQHRHFTFVGDGEKPSALAGDGAKPSALRGDGEKPSSLSVFEHLRERTREYSKAANSRIPSMGIKLETNRTEKVSKLEMTWGE